MECGFQSCERESWELQEKIFQITFFHFKSCLEKKKMKRPKRLTKTNFENLRNIWLRDKKNLDYCQQFLKMIFHPSEENKEDYKQSILFTLPRMLQKHLMSFLKFESKVALGLTCKRFGKFFCELNNNKLSKFETSIEQFFVSSDPENFSGELFKELKEKLSGLIKKNLLYILCSNFLKLIPPCMQGKIQVSKVSKRSSLMSNFSIDFSYTPTEGGYQHIPIKIHFRFKYTSAVRRVEITKININNLINLNQITISDHQGKKKILKKKY